MQNEGNNPQEAGLLAEHLARLPGDWAARLDPLTSLDSRELGWLGEESARVGSNLLVLLQRSGPEMLALGGRVTLSSLVGALGAALAAALLAGILYLIVVGPLLRRGWRSGRLIGCFAATFLILSAAVGGTWAGLWLGAGHALEGAIEKNYVLERTAVATFLAFTLESDELPGRADPRNVERLLAQAQRRSAASWEAFRSRAREAEESEGLDRPGWLRPELLAATVERLAGTEAPDLAALHRVLTTPPAEIGPDPLERTAGLRSRAVGLLRAHVYAQAATSAGLGFGLPLAVLLTVGLLGLLVAGSKPKEGFHPIG